MSENRSTWALTVAAVIARDGRFLMVEETDGWNPERVLNQPAGHVDPGESILAAVVRETLEETGLAFTPEAILGIYQLLARNGQDYCRICFSGSVPQGAEPRPRDPQILACHWLTREEIARTRLRSTLVLNCLDDFLAGRGHPLSLASEVRRDR